MLQMKFEGCLPGNYLFLKGGCSFCSIQAFNSLDKVPSFYRGQSALLKLTNLSVNLIQKHSRRNTPKNILPKPVPPVAQPR